MSIYLVNQGKTYKMEHAGGYIWSPKRNAGGWNNAGYKLMNEVRRGDFILHNSGGKISAISVVQRDCYDDTQPDELKTGQKEYEWDDDGYRIDTKYYDFDTPLINADLKLWAVNHPATDSCFDRVGKLKLRYLCNVAYCHAKYMLEEALRLQTKTSVRSVINRALESLETANALQLERSRSDL